MFQLDIDIISVLLIIVVAIYASARAEGKSMAVLDGKLIEYLHVHEASAVIRPYNELERSKS